MSISSKHSLPRRAFMLNGVALAAALQSGGARAQADDRKLKLGLANNVVTVIYPYLTNASAMGFWKAEDVNVDLVMGQGTPQALSLLVAGTVDVTFCNPEQMIQLNVERGMNLKSIYASSFGQYILAAQEDGPVHTVQDLKGKKLGMFSPQSGIDYLKRRLMESGLSVADISIVPISFGGQAIAAIRQKQVDAVLYWRDALTVIASAGLKLRELPKGDWEMGLYNYVAVAKAETIERKPDVLKRALRGMAQGQMMSVLSPEKTVEAFWQRYPDQAPKPEDRQAQLEYNVKRVRALPLPVPYGAPKEQVNAVRWGEQSSDVYNRLQDTLVMVGTLGKKVDPGSLYDNRFIEYANQFDRTALYTMAGYKA